MLVSSMLDKENGNLKDNKCHPTDKNAKLFCNLIYGSNTIINDDTQYKERIDHLLEPREF